MGMMGVENFTAVINPPHATIVAVGAGEQRPVVKDGALAIATVMNVTLSFDHRCHRRGAGRGTACGLQGLCRKPDGHAGLRTEAFPGPGPGWRFSR
jgi:pyruvate dehydrogenase E2 component (dihydrolipoamide acetyltransferase)